MLDGSRQYPWLPYTAPFFVFVILTEIANLLPAPFVPWIYIIKTICTALLLFIWRDVYRPELDRKLTGKELLTALFCGLVVLLIWVGGEPYLFQIGKATQITPHSLGKSSTALAFLIGFRLLGSSLIVPIMEELFWRSFLMRYFIDKEFQSVPLGSFTWFSFLATALLFGTEHNRILAGVIAGLLYGLLLIYQKKLSGVIIAHTVTNFGLGFYILLTGNWIFW